MISLKKTVLAFITLVLWSNISIAVPPDDSSELEAIKTAQEAQGKNLATALNQLQEVLTEFQKLNGEVDASLHATAEQKQLIEDGQKRLAVLEEKTALLTAQLNEIKQAGLLPAAQAKSFKEFQDYQLALSPFNSESYKETITGLKKFIAANPKSIYKDYAQYWIGESYFSLRDYPAALVEFQSVAKNEKSPKAAAALYKQGCAMYETQSFDDAKLFLNKLISKYPDTLEANLGKDKINQINRLLEQRAKEAAEQKSIK